MDGVRVGGVGWGGTRLVRYLGADYAVVLAIICLKEIVLELFVWQLIVGQVSVSAKAFAVDCAPIGQALEVVLRLGLVRVVSRLLIPGCC